MRPSGLCPPNRRSPCWSRPVVPLVAYIILIYIVCTCLPRMCLCHASLVLRALIADLECASKRAPWSASVQAFSSKCKPAQPYQVCPKLLIHLGGVVTSRSGPKRAYHPGACLPVALEAHSNCYQSRHDSSSVLDDWNRLIPTPIPPPSCAIVHGFATVRVASQGTGSGSIQPNRQR